MIERPYPGVFVDELAFRATPIEGVVTSTPASASPAALSRIPAHAPDWTNPSPHDTGVTLLDLLAYASESLLYGASRASSGHGVVSGLAVRSDDTHASDALHVSAGSALAPGGQPLERPSSSDALRVKKP